MFVWIFHRISGLILILLIGLKMYSGFGMTGCMGRDVIAFWGRIHVSLPVDMALTFLFIYHSLYGLRTCLIDLGVKREKELFWGFSVLGLALYILVCVRWFFHF